MGTLQKRENKKKKEKGAKQMDGTMNGVSNNGENGEAIIQNPRSSAFGCVGGGFKLLLRRKQALSTSRRLQRSVLFNGRSRIISRGSRSTSNKLFFLFVAVKLMKKSSIKVLFLVLQKTAFEISLFFGFRFCKMMRMMHDYCKQPRRPDLS